MGDRWGVRTQRDATRTCSQGMAFWLEMTDFSTTGVLLHSTLHRRPHLVSPQPPPSYHDITSIFYKTALNPSQPRNWALKTLLPGSLTTSLMGRLIQLFMLSLTPLQRTYLP